jgi:DNA-directed RNA polymerase subunit RPC12/RpoP
MSEWTCHNCGRVFRSTSEFRSDEQVLCPECKAKIQVLDAQKEYWEIMKRKAEADKTP